MTLTSVEVRDATPADAPFVAWTCFTAQRSHLPRGIFEFLLDASEEQLLALMERVTLSDRDHICHHARFRIAEMDGQPAAAMCGFDAESFDWNGMFMVAASHLGEVGLEFNEEVMERAAKLQGMTIPNEPGKVWVVENVACRPEFRRRGLIDRLLSDQIASARNNGYPVAQISVLIGNEPARRAYLKAGFELKGEARSDEMEAALGSPGGEKLAMSL